MGASPHERSVPTYDLFISYAGEDREFAHRLASELTDRGLHIWYDKFRLTLGQSIEGAIAEGLMLSRYGLVVLSPHSLRKPWPLRELRALLHQREGALLPVFHGLTPEQVAEKDPLLADIWGVSTGEGLEFVVAQVLERIRPGLRGARAVALQVMAQLAQEGESLIDEALDHCDLKGYGQLKCTLEQTEELMAAMAEAADCVARAESPEAVTELLHDVNQRLWELGGVPYCEQCGERMEMRNPQQLTLKSGLPATRGTCPRCGTRLVRRGWSPSCRRRCERL
ncbi:MAG: TIR domain-containing protein [Armatimonadia bacterium]